jgi:iron complex transport system substrate-binding protein
LVSAIAWSVSPVHCDYPAEAKRLPKIGDFMSPSLEVIAAKQPDLVIGVTGATDPARAREIERLGIKITLVSVSSVSEILSSFKHIAALLGDPDAGATLVEKITAQFGKVKRRIAPAPRRSTLCAVGLRPLVAVGGKNFLDELITLAGGENIAGNASQPWLNLPDEYVVAKAPQVIIPGGMGSDASRPTRQWSDLKSIPAVKERRVYTYNSDKILRPGPRIGEGLEEIARLIHPECFNVGKSRALEVAAVKVLDRKKLFLVNSVLLALLVLSAAAVHFAGAGATRSVTSSDSFVFQQSRREILLRARLPRVLLGVAIGGGMAACGVCPAGFARQPSCVSANARRLGRRIFGRHPWNHFLSKLASSDRQWTPR